MKQNGQSIVLLLAVVVLVVIAFGAGVFLNNMTSSSSEKTPPILPGPAPAKTQAPPPEPETPSGDTTDEKSPEPAPIATAPPAEEASEVIKPSGKQAFRWDFSREYKYVYDYQISATTNVGGQSGQNDATGKLTVYSQGNKSANLTLSDIVIAQTPDRQIPPTITLNFSEDSKFTHTTPSTDTMDELTFTLPLEELEVGESTTIPSRKTWTASNVPTWARGSTKITLKDYVLKDGHYCAQFELETDISKPEIPSGIMGEYTFSLTGTGTTFFDMTDKCFHSGEYTFLMIISVALGETKRTVKMDSTVKFTRNQDKEKTENQK